MAGVVWLAGCGGVIEDVASACIDLDGPEFTTDALPPAVLGQPYGAEVVVELVNEPYDDDFGYAFNVRGSLPAGLEVRQVRGRRLEIAGVPTAPGTYEFVVFVSVSEPPRSPEEPPVLCWDAAERTYRIAVGPGPG